MKELFLVFVVGTNYVVKTAPGSMTNSFVSISIIIGVTLRIMWLGKDELALSSAEIMVKVYLCMSFSR